MKVWSEAITTRKLWQNSCLASVRLALVRLASTVRRSRVRSLDYAVAIEDHNVCSRVASHQKLVREQILAILGVDNFQLSDQYYYRLYWAHALTRHYLITGRKYALIKEYALNKHVHLLTRLYGILPNSYKISELHVWRPALLFMWFYKS